MKHLNAAGYNTDKGHEHIQYLRIYEEVFAPFVDKEIRLLELGVKDGGSLLLWRDYFKKGTIVGVDMIPLDLQEPRIYIYTGRQEDRSLLDIFVVISACFA